MGRTRDVREEPGKQKPRSCWAQQLARSSAQEMRGRKRGPIELDESGRDERNRLSENPRQESRVDRAPELVRTEKPLGLVAHDYIRVCTYALTTTSRCHSMRRMSLKETSTSREGSPRSTQLRLGRGSAIRLPWEVTIGSLQLMEASRAGSPPL